LSDRSTLCRNVCLLVVLFFGMIVMPFPLLVTSAAEVNIITRIERGTDWILGQAVEYQEKRYGFTSETGNERKIFSEDNARVAWTLCNYHRHFTSERHDRWLRASAEFVLESQAETLDFYRHYDLKLGQWAVSGTFYYWNAHIAALMAQTAFTMRTLPEGGIEYEFWDIVIQRIESSIDSWIETSMKTDGSWVFTYPEARTTRTEDVGMMLSALSCISGYEHEWGDRIRAERFYGAAQKTLEWVLEQQEMNRNSWGYGGFYDNHSKTIQTTLSNGRAMFGLLSYWTFVGLMVPEPDYGLLRKRMIAWTEGFAVPTMDHHGGPSEHRTETLAKVYPKKTLNAAEFVRDLAFVWVDLGGSYYWSLAELCYYWLVGRNEMNLDMQQVNNTRVVHGGFYVAIENSTHVDTKSTVETTAECVEAMLHAMSIDIPEITFSRSSAVFAVAATAALLLVRAAKRRQTKHRRLPATSLASSLVKRASRTSD